MPEIASAAAIASKWARVTPSRSQDYTQGVSNPRRDWADATQEAAENYNTAIQAAINAGRFQAGVERAGTSKWRAKTLQKGPGRWAQGVQSGAQDYESGFAPFRAVIAGTTLPPRGPRGSEQNIERARVMAAALHQAKLDQA